VLRVMMAKAREGRFSVFLSLLAAWEELAAGVVPRVREGKVPGGARRLWGGGMLAGAGSILLLALMWLWFGGWWRGGEESGLVPEVKFLNGPQSGSDEAR